MTIKAEEYQRTAIIDAVDKMVKLGIEDLVDTGILPGEVDMVSGVVSVMISLLATAVPLEDLRGLVLEVLELNSDPDTKGSLLQ